MEPQVWGPHGWFFLHSVTMAYPEKPTKKDKEDYFIFFNTLTKVLPCEVCRKHFKQHMAEIPIEPALQSRQTLVEWLIKIHNLVRALYQLIYDISFLGINSLYLVNKTVGLSFQKILSRSFHETNNTM